MVINKKVDGDSTILEIEGWLDVETTGDLHKYMESLTGSKKLIFDFSKLEYISSAGVREVVAAYRRQKAAQGTFAVVGSNQDVLDVFRMTGLDKKLDIS